MKRVAILNCGDTAKRCAGTGCFRALREYTGGFAPYADEGAELTAYCVCSSCGKPPEDDPDMHKKLMRIAEVGTEVVHIGKCAQKGGVRCPTMEAYARCLEEQGVGIVWKTH